MAEWFFAKNREKIGPMNDAEAVKYAQDNPHALAWTSGMHDWLQADQIGELSAENPPQISEAPSNYPAPKVAHEIDYKIYGDDMQFVEIELDPGEIVVSEAGAMMYKKADIKMESILGNSLGSNSIMGKLMAAGSRIITGESLYLTAFTHEGDSGKSHVAFGAPFPGTIIPVNLMQFDGTLICQKDSFLCAAKGVSVAVHFQKKILTGLFGGEGFIMQRLEGDGMAFVHAGGTIHEIILQEGEKLHVDTGCVVAYTAEIDFNIHRAGSIKTMLFGREGFFFAELTGPGQVWVQSLPFSRLAGRMLQANSEIYNDESN